MTDMSNPVSVYSKKTVTLRVGGVHLELLAAHDLFSSHTIDAGSRLLLRSLTSTTPPASILDLGCGYGTLGLGLKARFPETELDLVDRDALAVHFASANAHSNGFAGARAYASLGYDGIPATSSYDLIVSNLPGKAGEPVVRELLVGASTVLRSGGMVAIVVVASLAASTTELLQSDGAEIVERLEGKAHTVLHYRPDPANRALRRSAFRGGVYRRNEGAFQRAGLSWRAATSWGIPEFDSLGFGTSLMIDLIVNGHLSGPKALVVNPGQGHAACAIARGCAPNSMTLAGRDLLELETSRLNVERNGYPAIDLHVEHSPVPGPAERPYDLIAASLPPKLPSEITEESVRTLAAQVADGGTLILGGRSTTVTRSLQSRHLASFSLRERSRRHGYSAARLQR
jgi:16S rRNA (guanine1207-N2)-methyltransferase